MGYDTKPMGLCECPECHRAEWSVMSVEVTGDGTFRRYVEGDMTISCRCWKIVSIAKGESIDRPDVRRKQLRAMWNAMMEAEREDA